MGRNHQRAAGSASRKEEEDKSGHLDLEPRNEAAEASGPKKVEGGHSLRFVSKVSPSPEMDDGPDQPNELEDHF